MHDTMEDTQFSMNEEHGLKTAVNEALRSVPFLRHLDKVTAEVLFAYMTNRGSAAHLVLQEILADTEPSSQELARAANSRTEHLGEVLCREGEIGDRLFLLAVGSCEIEVGGRIVTTLEAWLLQRLIEP